jgi:flagellar protein FlgJ
MSVITMSVGPGKANQHDDVIIVQRLLNRHCGQLAPHRVLKLDGRWGKQTEEAIRLFQSRVVHMSTPDGCVDLHGHTLAALTSGVTQTSTQHAHHIPANVNAFVARALPAARRVSAKWDVPVAVILAQSALESGWGKHVVHNAYFGIKGKSPSGNSTSFATTEVIGGKVIHLNDQFRAYKDYEESADDYARFLNENQRYRSAFSYTNNPVRFIEEIARAGYATDPHYAASLKSIIRNYGFEQYDMPQGSTLP